MPPLLSETKVGQSGKTESISASDSKSCLEGMGFYPNMRIVVLSSARIMRVKLSGTTLAIDRRMAESINVELDTNSKEQQA